MEKEVSVGFVELTKAICHISFHICNSRIQFGSATDDANASTVFRRLPEGSLGQPFYGW